MSHRGAIPGLLQESQARATPAPAKNGPRWHFSTAQVRRVTGAPPARRAGHPSLCTPPHPGGAIVTPPSGLRQDPLGPRAPAPPPARCPPCPRAVSGGRSRTCTPGSPPASRAQVLLPPLPPRSPPLPLNVLPRTRTPPPRPPPRVRLLLFFSFFRCSLAFRRLFLSSCRSLSFSFFLRASSGVRSSSRTARCRSHTRPRTSAGAEAPPGGPAGS